MKNLNSLVLVSAVLLFLCSLLGGLYMYSHTIPHNGFLLAVRGLLCVFIATIGYIWYDLLKDVTYKKECQMLREQLNTCTTSLDAYKAHSKLSNDDKKEILDLCFDDNDEIHQDTQDNTPIVKKGEKLYLGSESQVKAHIAKLTVTEKFINHLIDAHPMKDRINNKQDIKELVLMDSQSFSKEYSKLSVIDREITISIIRSFEYSNGQRP